MSFEIIAGLVVVILGAIAGFLGTAYLIYVAKRTKN